MKQSHKQSVSIFGSGLLVAVLAACSPAHFEQSADLASSGTADAASVSNDSGASVNPVRTLPGLPSAPVTTPISSTDDTSSDSSSGSASSGSSSGSDSSSSSSSSASNSSSESSGSSSSSNDTSSNSSTDVVNQIIANCDEAAAANALMVDAETIDFTQTTNTCAWGTGDNLSKQDGSLRARAEQNLALKNLPAKAVVCDMQMTVSQTHFRYDDVFLLTLNGRVLATNDKTALLAKSAPEFSAQLDNKSVPVFKYDWLNIRNQGFKNVADDYCLGAAQGLATCSWPITEQTGQITLQFDHRLLINLSADAAHSQSFGLVVTGDNDASSDCKHEDLQIGMRVKYYIAE